MKHLLLLFTFVFALFAGCNSPEPEKTTVLSYLTPYAAAPEYLSGQIKSVQELNFWAIEKDGVFEKGNLITRTERDSIGWTSDFTAFYDEAGVHTQTDYVTYDMKTTSWVMESENGLWTKATFIRDDTSRVYFVFKYDENLHYKESKRFRYGVDTLLNTYSFITNNNGNIIEQENFNSKGEKLVKYVYSYLDNNMTEEYTRYSPTDSLLSSVAFLYNEKGFFIKGEYLNGLGEIRTIIDLDYTEYDEMGNWLSAIVSEKGEVSIITERIYEYY